MTYIAVFRFPFDKLHRIIENNEMNKEGFQFRSKTCQTGDQAVQTDGGQNEFHDCKKLEEQARKISHLQKQLDVVNRKLDNARHVADAHREFSQQAEEKQIVSDQKATNARWALKRTKERYAKLEHQKRVQRIQSTLKKNRTETIEMEAKVRDLRANPFATESHLRKAKSQLKELRSTQLSASLMLGQLMRTEKIQEELLVAASNNNVYIVKELMTKGFSVNVPDDLGFSAFKYACGQGSIDVVKYIIDHGEADINHCDEKSIPPLILAAKNAQDAVLEHLLSGGAEPNVKDRNGRTALHIVCHSGRYEAAQKLIESGADIDSIDMKGNSAIFYGAGQNHACIVTLLMQKGASTRYVNSDENSALAVAKKAGAKDVVKILQS